MVLPPKPQNGSKNGSQGAPEPGQVQLPVRIVAQYIRDLSFEAPGVEKMLGGITEEPKLGVEVNVNARNMKDRLFESALDMKAKAENKDGVFYDLHVVYTGLFEVGDIPEEALEPLLLIHAPSLLFPFARRIIADLTREGGFPPLLLDPMDFASMYHQRRMQRGEPTGPAIA
ncbi:MAG: Protein-export protein SecB [Pseudomonadota bacterium]